MLFFSNNDKMFPNKTPLFMKIVYTYIPMTKKSQIPLHIYCWFSPKKIEFTKLQKICWKYTCFTGKERFSEEICKIANITTEKLTYIRGRRGRNEAFHPSIRPVIHPWMASLQSMWLRFCCTRRNSHIIQQCFFVFWRNFANWRQKKNPVRPLGRN